MKKNILSISKEEKQRILEMHYKSFAGKVYMNEEETPQQDNLETHQITDQERAEKFSDFREELRCVLSGSVEPNISSLPTMKLDDGVQYWFNSDGAAYTVRDGDGNWTKSFKYFCENGKPKISNWCDEKGFEKRGKKGDPWTYKKITKTTGDPEYCVKKNQGKYILLVMFNPKHQKSRKAVENFFETSSGGENNQNQNKPASGGENNQNQPDSGESNQNNTATQQEVNQTSFENYLKTNSLELGSYNKEKKIGSDKNGVEYYWDSDEKTFKKIFDEV
jgi:hypothetical protein